MLNPGAILRAARKAARLPPFLFARLAGLSEGAVSAAEKGETELTAAELDRCARVFGVRLDDLLDGNAGRSPLSLLMRSNLQGQTPQLQDLLATDLHAGLGDFLRVVRDLADLERLLGLAVKPIPKLTPLPSPADEHPGENRARTLRAHLGLGMGPIPSLRKIVERDLGIRVVWVTEDQLDRSVEGACTIDPRPAVLVNIGQPARYPWRMRMTLAHELCHLFFDDEVRTHRALVSPLGNKAATDLKIDRIEQRARAFAACFLAPAAGVRHAVAAKDPTSEEAIRITGSTFGVGRTVAINRLQHAFGLSDDQRKAMDTRVALSYDGDFKGDAVDEPLGFRAGALYGLVEEALLAKKIGGARARRLIGLTPADALPFPSLDETVRAPLVSEAERMRRRAQALLLAEPARGDLMADRAELEGDTWRVIVISGGIGAREAPEAGHLLLSRAGELIEDHVVSPGKGGPSIRG